MANVGVMIEYVDGMEGDECNKFMDMIKKYDIDLYNDIFEYIILKYYDENVELKEDYDVMKELGV